jgi:pantoate--beta-alanine ligase
MDVITNIAELHTRLSAEDSVAFVPTMGNLHDGHLALVELARQHASCVVVSIFVNPLQFAANEDLASYPRTLQQDCEKLTTAGVDVVFTPTDAELYPQAQTIMVELPGIAQELCGAVRPTHFEGVATVVLKLFNIVRPQVAVFGSKDFQQLFIIGQLIQQLALPIKLISGATVREADGLAMSSRNGYLKAAERIEAPRLYRVLQQIVQQVVQQGQRDFVAIESQTMQYLTQLGWIVDYISIRNAMTLAVANKTDKKLVVLGAARLGKTRLIDNIEFEI